MNRFFVRVPWGQLRVTSWGKKSNDPDSKKLLLINGNFSWTGSWNSCAEKISEKENISIVGFDYPGQVECEISKFSEKIQCIFFFH